MAGQVASSRRKQTAGRDRQPPQRRAPEHKILRIGIIHNGRIVEERLIPAGQGVTVGDSSKCTVVITGGDLPRKRFELFVEKNGHYDLNFTKSMHGKVSVAENIQTLASLAQKGTAKKRGDHFTLSLSEKNRGKVYVGDHTILFQFVTPPPQPARARTSDFRAFRWDDVDWVFLAILLLSALLHTAAVIWIESQPPPKTMRLEDFPDRFVRLMLPKEQPEPEPEPTADEGEGEAADKADEATPADEPEPEDDGGAEETPEEQPETKEARDTRINETAAQQGILAIIGTAGDSSTSEAVADLLSDASSLSDDVGKALANSSGVAIGRRDSDQSGLRGGGGDGSAAGIGDLAGAEGGAGGAVTKKKTELKGNVGTGKAEISSSPEDTASISRTMKRYTGRIKQCYERQLKGDPDLKGKVTVSFEIDTEGNVSGVGIEENSTGNAELANCIKREIGRIRFVPAPADDVEVAGYPFILAPG